MTDVSNELTLVLLGATLRQARKAKGLGQEAIADAVGIRQPYVSRIERGKTAGVPAALLGRIARVLGLRLALVPLETDEEELVAA